MKIKSLAILAVIAFGFTACSDAWLEEKKLDQNRPSEVSMGVLLPSAQAGCGMLQGDVLPRLTSIFMQQMTGTDRQSLAHNRYAQIGEGDFNTPWNNSYILIERLPGREFYRIAKASAIGHFIEISRIKGEKGEEYDHPQEAVQRKLFKVSQP